jgi:hypothetical protein
MPKANTRCILRTDAIAPRVSKFSNLRCTRSLAWQVRLLLAGIISETAKVPKLKLERPGAHMFDGKNNRILDSFSFRLALTAAVFAAWSGAGYILLSLA